MNKAESQAFQMGYIAYHDFKSLADNPFVDVGTKQALWKDGFLVAQTVYNSDAEYPLALHKSLGIE